MRIDSASPPVLYNPDADHQKRRSGSGYPFHFSAAQKGWCKKEVTVGEIYFSCGESYFYKIKIVKILLGFVKLIMTSDSLFSVKVSFETINIGHRARNIEFRMGADSTHKSTSSGYSVFSVP